MKPKLQNFLGHGIDFKSTVKMSPAKMSLSEKNLPKIFQPSVDDSSKSQSFRSSPHTQIIRSKKIFFSRSLLLVIYKTERRSKINSYDRKTVKNFHVGGWTNRTHKASLSYFTFRKFSFNFLDSFVSIRRLNLQSVKVSACPWGVYFHCLHHNLSVFLKDPSIFSTAVSPPRGTLFHFIASNIHRVLLCVKIA